MKDLVAREESTIARRHVSLRCRDGGGRTKHGDTSAVVDVAEEVVGVDGVVVKNFRGREAGGSLWESQFRQLPAWQMDSREVEHVKYTLFETHIVVEC